MLRTSCTRSDAAARVWVSPRLQADRLAAARGELELQGVAAADFAALNCDGERMRTPVGIGAVAIDLRAIAAVGIEEVELHCQRACVFVCDTAEIPVVAVAILAHDRHVVADFTVRYQ